MGKSEMELKCDLIKNALNIVNELAKSDLGDVDESTFTSKDFEYEKLQDLIIKARKIKRNPLFRL